METQKEREERIEQVANEIYQKIGDEIKKEIIVFNEDPENYEVEIKGQSIDSLEIRRIRENEELQDHTQYEFYIRIPCEQGENANPPDHIFWEMFIIEGISQYLSDHDF